MKALKIVMFSLLVFMLAACNAGNDEGGAPEEGADPNNGDVQEEKGEIILGRNNWAENIAVSAMWEILLEERGYEVEAKAMDKAPVWLGISRGDLDIAPEVWLPNTDASFIEEYGENVAMHEIWYENTRLGLAVPTYMDINSMEELNDLGLEKIIGIDPGTSLNSMTKTAIEEYGLEYDLVESSGPAMMSELSKSYRNEEPIVVTLWSPHWAFSEYDLKYLEDPKKVYGEPDDIYYMTRTGFEEDHPEIIQWMNNWKMDDDSLGSLMAIIKDLNSPEEGAQQWIEENRELVDQWFE